MIFEFKRYFMSISAICENIQNNSSELKEAMLKFDDLNPKIKKHFEDLKEHKPELDKLKVQVAKLKEYHPQLQNSFHEKKEKVLEINQQLYLKINSFLDMIDSSVNILKNIMLDADALMYKENKIRLQW